ncbi:MAG: hypothetical protein AB2L24_12820 [Mangrovibacterium sp.]
MKIWKRILLGFISVILIMMIVDISALRNNIDIINKIDDLEISKQVELTQSNKIAYLLQQINSNQREIFLDSKYSEKLSELTESRIIIDENILRMHEAIHELANATQIEFDFSKKKEDIEKEENKLFLVDSLIYMTDYFIASVRNILKLQGENRN